jgi:isopentenyl diphosphate isomerase/L-lactate dehydrogenase-like FMN-dependent dehydrogenase
VRHAIDILAAELDEAMALAGVRDVAAVTPDFVRAH